MKMLVQIVFMIGIVCFVFAMANVASLINDHVHRSQKATVIHGN